MTTFLLIRHGLTDDVAQRLSGRAEGVHLNAAGHAQAAGAAARLEDVRLAAVLSSPLERARETAQPIAEGHHLEIEVMPEFGEFDFGEWTGRSIHSLSADEQWQRFNAARSVTRSPAGESMLAVQHRAVSALLELTGRFAEQIVVIVSHGDVIRAILLYCLGMPIDFVHRIEVSPGRISIVAMHADGPRVLQVNGDTASAVG